MDDCVDRANFSWVEYHWIVYYARGHGRRVGYVYCISEHIDFRMVARHVNNFVSCAECYYVMVIVIVGGRNILNNSIHISQCWAP